MQQAQDDVDEAPGTTGDNSETVNGLECKLSTQTSKVWIASAPSACHFYHLSREQGHA